MARPTKKRSTSTAQRSQFQPQDLLLAGIGALSLGRKQVTDAYANGFEDAAELGNLAREVVLGAAQVLSSKVLVLRKKAKAKAAPMKKKVLALVTEASSQAQARLAPVLARLGVAKASAKRSPSRKKPAARSRRAA